MFSFLGDGRALASGFSQSIMLGQIAPTININNTFCCFYQNYNLVEFLCCYLNEDIRKRGKSTEKDRRSIVYRRLFQGLSMKDRPLLVRKVLKCLWFVTCHTNEIRRYRLKAFGQSALQHKFVKNEGEQITVADYFQVKWQIHLRYPELPVVELYNPAFKGQSNFLPMELVTIDQWQRSLKPLTTEQRAKMTKKSVVRPGERYQIIRRIVDQRQFEEDVYLQRFGITVDTSEMLQLSARVLPPPEIKYKSSNGDVVERVQIGKWWLNNRFNRAREIRRWSVILLSQREPDHRQIRLARDFTQRIPQVRLQRFTSICGGCEHF